VREAIVVDARRARRLRLSRTARGSLHVAELEQLEEHWDEKQHHRPYMLAAHGRSFAGTSHEKEERLQRFARELAAWLERGAPVEGPLPVLCSPPMLGALRTEASAALLARLDLRETDLGWLNLDELARHPAITALLPPAAG
jgi:hypothetical protein